MEFLTFLRNAEIKTYMMAYLYLASEKAKLFSLVKTRLQLNTKIGINHHPQASLIFQVYRLNFPFSRL